MNFDTDRSLENIEYDLNKLNILLKKKNQFERRMNKRLAGKV